MNNTFDGRFSEFYETNKERLTQMSEEQKARVCFEGGFYDADSIVPLVVAWALSMSKEYSVSVMEDDGQYVAGVGNLFMKGPSALGCFSHLAATIMKEGVQHTENCPMTAEKGLIIADDAIITGE